MRHFPWGANKIFISFMHSLVSKMLCEEEWQVESLLSIFWQIYCYLKILVIICQGQRIHCRYKSTSKSLRCDIFRLIWSKTSSDRWRCSHNGLMRLWQRYRYEIFSCEAQLNKCTFLSVRPSVCLWSKLNLSLFGQLKTT